jgi:hypothetical protein
VSLTLDDVTRIAEDAARAASSSLRVAGVTFGGSADSHYVEILLNIEGCRTSPCRLAIGTFRDLTEPALHDEIVHKLREHLTSHRAP